MLGEDIPVTLAFSTVQCARMVPLTGEEPGSWRTIVACLERRDERIESIINKHVPELRGDQLSFPNTLRRTMGREDVVKSLVSKETPQSTR